MTIDCKPRAFGASADSPASNDSASWVTGTAARCAYCSSTPFDSREIVTSGKSSAVSEPTGGTSRFGPGLPALAFLLAALPPLVVTDFASS